MNRTACALAVGIAIGAAAVAAPVYLSHHRNSVKGSTEPLETVLVAKRLIPKGTSGSSIAAQNLFLVTTIPKDRSRPKRSAIRRYCRDGSQQRTHLSAPTAGGVRFHDAALGRLSPPSLNSA